MKRATIINAQYSRTTGKVEITFHGPSGGSFVQSLPLECEADTGLSRLFRAAGASITITDKEGRIIGEAYDFDALAGKQLDVVTRPSDQ